MKQYNIYDDRKLLAENIDAMNSQEAVQIYLHRETPWKKYYILRVTGWRSTEKDWDVRAVESDIDDGKMDYLVLGDKYKLARINNKEDIARIDNKRYGL